jgi:hypothetical protein
MKILHIDDKKRVRKTKKELEKELKDTNRLFLDEYKYVPAKEQTYIVEMSEKEFQLVSFYFELENRKPIMNVEVDAKLKENKNER